MSERELKELHLEKHHELIRFAFGRDSAFALCDHEGAPVWTSSGAPEEGIGGLISRLNEAGLAWQVDESGLLRRELDGGRALFYERVAADDIGWLAVLVERLDPQPDAGRLRSLSETLVTVASCIADELRLNFELDNLAGELERRSEELNLVYSLNELARAEPPAGLKALLGHIALYVGVDLAAFVSPPQGMTTYATNAGQTLPDLDLLLVEMQANLLRFVASSKKTLILNDRVEPRRQYLFTHLPYKVLACPVADGSDVQPMLVLLRRQEGRDFLASDRSLATVIAAHVGVTLRNYAAVEKMRRFGDQLAGALIGAVEAKDPYTAGHSERVQTVSIHIGRALGMERSDLEDLFWGSVMHDVGKIGIPDVILAKPGKLTADEYTFIQTHPQRSYEILSHIDHLRQNALEGARFHHERFDGGGYPLGLRAREIPLHARIIAVADTYDAMTSSRSYRTALAHEATIAEIERVAGTQLDPEVVRAFAGACRSDPAVREHIRFRSDRKDG